MFCPNLSDPEIKRKFESLKSVYPEGAYYLWDKYQGEVPAKYYNLPAYSSKSINNLTPEELQTVQNTLENQLIIEQDTDLAFKSGQAYHYLNSEDSARMSSLVERHKEYPKEFKVTKKVTKYERKGLDFKSYNVYKDFIYVKTSNNKKSNLYNIIDKETGELVQEKVRVIHLSKDVKSKIAKDYGLDHTPTKVFNANRSVAFALYRQKPSKAKYVAQAKKYLYDAIKFLNPNESNLTINLNQIEKMLDSFPEEMWDYINTTYSPEDSTNINASTSLQNSISIKLPKLGLIKEIEKITGLPILGQSFKNYDRSGKLKKALRVEWGNPVTIDATLTKKQLHAAIGYYLRDKGYFKATSEQENVRKYAEHNNINPDELAELVFGDFEKALDNVAWNMSGNSDSIEVSKWRESIRNYEWQSVELLAKPYENFNEKAKDRIIEKFKDKKLSNGISHLEYFFTGKFNWLNINFNNISGQYYLADNETLAPVGVSYKTAGIQNVFQMANYRKPKAGENFLKEEEVFNRLAAILHEPMHALHALSYGSKEELALRKSFEDLAKTEFGKQMLTQAFGDQYNNKSITPDILYKEFTAFATQLILYPKEWIDQTNLRSNDILDFIEKIQNLQDKTYTETVKTIEKIGEQEIEVTTEEKIKLDFLQKLYNYLISALNRVIPISKQFFKLIPSTNLITQKVIEDVFGEVERTQERTLELPKSIVRSKQEFLDAMDQFKNAIQGLMQTDASMFSSDNVKNFFQKNDSFAQENNRVKPGISDLFESNPKLANAVYESLGFNDLINPTDRIIWGHPTIGKTTAKQEKNFLDFDTDFKPLVAEKLGLPKSKQNSVDLNKWRETGSEEDFNKAMQEVWSLAKEQAKSQNKILMVSDMLFLRENASDFDKVINIPSDVFLNRAAQRKDSVENLQSWKANIDKTLEKIDSKKIITTDKYLSDLFLSPEQKQKAQQLYSQYLETLLPEGTIQYRGDQKGLAEFRYSTPTEESRKTGNVHKLGPGVYTTTSQEKALKHAENNKGEVYPVLVSKGLVFEKDLDFRQAVANDLGIETLPTTEQLEQFVKKQQALGNSIHVNETGETVSTVKDVIPLNSPRVIEGFKNYVKNIGPIKEGVSELFESNPELAKIGTPQQYSQYLDFILKDSEAKEVLYHGTYENFDQFLKENRGKTTGLGTYTDKTTGEIFDIDSNHAFFFTDSKNTATSYSFKGRTNYIEQVEAALRSVSVKYGRPMDPQKAVDYLKTIPYYNKLIETAKSQNKTKEEIIDLLKNEWIIVRERTKGKDFRTFTNWKDNNESDIASVKTLLQNISKLKNNDPSINIRFGDFTQTTLGRDNFSIFFEDGEYTFVSPTKRFKSSEVTTQELESYLTEFLNLLYEDDQERVVEQKKAGYIENVVSVVLKIQNPLRHDYKGSSFVDVYKPNEKYEAGYIAARQVKSAIKAGNDSVIYENIKDPLLSTSYGVFEPEQIHILGNKQDIEGFKQFVSKPSENVMYSRSANREAVINALLTEDQFKDLLIKTSNLQLTGDPVQNRELVKNYIWENVKASLNYNGNFTVQGNTIRILPSKNVKDAQPKGIAGQYVRQLNKKYFSKILNDSFKYKLIDGVPSIVFEPSMGLLDVVASAVNRDQINEAEIAREIEAEIALINIAENAKAENLGLLEKLASANEAVIDGEVFALNNSVFDSRISLMRWTSRETTQKFGKVLDKLSERFPGVTWEWDTTIDNPGKVDLNSGKILVNPSLINEDTPWHEFGHILVRMIKQSNPELFNLLKKDLQRIHELAPQISSKTYVEELYPEYIGTELFWEEAIVTELGRQSVDVYEKATDSPENYSIYQRIKNWVNNLLSSILGNEYTLKNTTTIADLAQILAGTETKFEVDLSAENAVSEYMFSRILSDAQKNLLISQIETPEGTTDYTEWGTKLKDLTSKIDIEEFRKLIFTNKFLGVDSIALETARRALTRISDIITAEDVAEAMLDLAEFYQYGAFYLSRLEANMKLIEQENKLPIAKQLSIFHNSYKQAIAFESYFNELQKLFKVGTSLPTSTEERQATRQIGFLANAFSINTSIRQIKEAHAKRIEKPVAKILAENFKHSTEKLTEDFNKEIAHLTKLNKSGKLTKKIKKLEKQRDELTATEENIIKFFKQEVNNTWLPQGLQWADTNTTSNDPAVNIVANYINDMINEARTELIPVSTMWQNLMSEISEVQGNFTGTFIDVKEFYKPYYRITEEYEVVNGELVKGKKVLVLNTPAKIQELQNRFTELNYIISTSEDELKRNEAEDELKRLYEDYTERPFTDEYYALQKLLPEKVRAIRQEKFDLISALHETLVMEDDANSEQTVYRLKLANKELYDLERLYDDLGNLKTGEEKEIAEAIIQWKEARRDEVAIIYEISEESKGTYERELAKRKLIRDTNVANAASQQAKDEAIQAYNNWTSIYSRTVYSEQFYLERESILKQIHTLLGKTTDTNVDALYKEIFNALRGRKDKNNQYDARDITPEFTRTLKLKEEAIEAAKRSVKKSPLDKEDKEYFFSLLEELEDLQTSVPTEHYKDTVESIKASLRTQILSENPGLDLLSLEKEVESRFKQSQWYIDNHVIKVRWNKEAEEMQTVMEPLFMWKVTVPKNPNYILKEQPSFYWFKAKVNPKFKNPNYKPGEVNFKPITSGTYYNSGYDQLSPSQKVLLGKIRDAHYATQEGIYTRDKLYDKIPGLEKSLGEISLDTIKLKNNPLKEFFAKTKNIVTFNTENDPDELSEGIADQSDVFGNTLDKSARRIFLRYSRALPLEEQSYDIMAAMASYAAAAVRFKTIRKYQSSLLSTEETLNTLAGSESTRAKLIQNMMDRVVYGRSRRKVESGAGKLITSVTSGVSKLAGSAVLGLNVKAIPKNWFNGYFTSWTQMQQNGLTKNDFAKAHIDTLGLSKEYFTEFAQFGKSSLKLQLIDYFVGLQHNPFRDAKDISNVGLRKYGKFWKIASTLRAYSEFDIAANIVFAFLNKHRVKIKGSTQTIPLKDAFVSKDGVITLRDDVDVTEDFIAYIKREIQLANTRSQGAYDEMAQPEAIKFAAVRMTLWMKRFVVQHLKTTYGGETIHYGAGIRTVGGHRALLNVMRDFFSTGTFVGMSAHDKAGLLQLAKSYSGYILLANMIKAMSLIGNCEDDGVADWKDTVCFYLKSVNSEVEGVFTLWGMNEFLNTYYQEKANNISAIEKFGSSIWGPYSTISKWFDSDLWTTDPYYKYKPNSTKVDWDRTHPLFAGKPGLWVLAQKVLGSAGLAIDPTSTEYDNRRFNVYTPKTYTKQLATEFTEGHKGVKERSSRTPIGQVKKQFKKEVLEIKREIIQAQQRGEDTAPLYLKLREAQENAKKAIQNIRENPNKDKDYSIDILPMPFWKRKGQDLEEMADDNE